MGILKQAILRRGFSYLMKGYFWPFPRSRIVISVLKLSRAIDSVLRQTASEPKLALVSSRSQKLASTGFVVMNFETGVLFSEAGKS